MNKAYLLIGGNVGDRAGQLIHAQKSIGEKCGNILVVSSTYETAAWGKTDQAAFLNQCLMIETTAEPEELLHQLLEIEKQMGRIRREKYGPRLIDLDILFYGDKIVDLPRLKIPHPEIQFRRFALAPMLEIAPDFIHPVLKKNIRTLYTECTDPLDVKKI